MRRTSHRLASEFNDLRPWAMGQNILISSGTILDDGVIFLSLNLLLGDGVMLSDGILVGDGIMVGDGVIVGDSSLGSLFGDNTTCMH